MSFVRGALVDDYTGLAWCGQGLHLLTEANTYVSPAGGRRRCRPCMSASAAARRQRAARTVRIAAGDPAVVRSRPTDTWPAVPP